MKYIYINDKLQAEYEDALEKLKADKYENKIPKAEKRKLEEKVMRWLMIEDLEQRITELNEGASPYDYEGFENLNIDKVFE
jgi:predicted nuclease with TOPRIM domain